MEATATKTEPATAQILIAGDGIEVADYGAPLIRAMVLVFATDADVRKALADGVVRITWGSPK